MRRVGRPDGAGPHQRGAWRCSSPAIAHRGRAPHRGGQMGEVRRPAFLAGAVPAERFSAAGAQVQALRWPGPRRSTLRIARPVGAGSGAGGWEARLGRRQYRLPQPRRRRSLSVRLRTGQQRGRQALWGEPAEPAALARPAGAGFCGRPGQWVPAGCRRLAPALALSAGRGPLSQSTASPQAAQARTLRPWAVGGQRNVVDSGLQLVRSLRSMGLAPDPPRRIREQDPDQWRAPGYRPAPSARRGARQSSSSGRARRRRGAVMCSPVRILGFFEFAEVSRRRLEADRG